MRELNTKELQTVSGGEWEITIGGPGIEIKVSGPESAQEIAAAAAAVASDAYWGARDAMAGFYEWVASSWNYAMACSYHYY